MGSVEVLTGMQAAAKAGLAWGIKAALLILAVVVVGLVLRAVIGTKEA